MENKVQNQEQHLTHWKRLVNPDYLGVYSLDNGKDMTLTISKVVREYVKNERGQEECTVAYFKENQKPMILNRTNSKAIQKLYGTPYIEQWTGKKITVYAATTKLKGDDVECLRIRPQKPENPLLRVEDTLNFTKCKEALKSGYTINDLKTKWTISAEVEKALTNDAI